MKTTKTNKTVTQPATGTSSESDRPTLEQARAAAKKLERLRVKYAALDDQLTRTRIEAQQNWDILNRAMVPNFASFAGTGCRPPVQNPRPIADKLIISAGRAIAKAVKNGNNVEQTKTAAVNAASVVAKKYRLPSVPQEIIASIESRAKRRFNVVSA